MFCENCGKQIPDDANICPYCGIPQQAEAPKPEVEYDPMTGKPIETVFDPMTGKRVVKRPDTIGGSKKKLPKFVIPVAAVAAVCVVGGSIFAYANTPERRFQRAEKKIIEDEVNNAMAIYDNYLKSDLDPTNAGFTCSADMSLGDAGKRYVDLLDAAGVDLSDLKSVALSADGGAKDKEASGTAKLTVNGEDSITLNSYLDFSSDPELLMYIPEITKDRLGFKSEEWDNYIDEYLDQVMGSGDSADLSPESLKKLQDALPSKSVLKKELTRYATVIVKSMDEVDQRKTSIEAENVSEKVTELSVDIDDDMLQKIADNLSDSLDDDKELKKIYDNLSDALEDVYDADMPSYDDYLDNLQDALDDVGDSDGNDLTYTIYVRGLGVEAAGRKLEDEEGRELSYIMPRHGRKWGLERIESRNGTDRLEINGSGTGGDSALTGEISDEDNELGTLTLEKFNLNSLKKGLPNGKVTVELGDDLLDNMGSRAEKILDGMKFGFDFNTRKHNIGVKFSLDDSAGNIATVNLKAKAGKAGKVEKPDAKDYVDLTRDNGYRDFMKDADLDVIKDILKDFGLRDYARELDELEDY